MKFMQEKLEVQVHKNKAKIEQFESTPQLGGVVTTASRKIRRRWMKRDRANIAAVPLQRGDACRSTAIRVQQPQLGGTVTAASHNIRRRWMKLERVNSVDVFFQRADACHSTAIRIQPPQLGDMFTASRKNLPR